MNIRTLAVPTVLSVGLVFAAAACTPDATAPTGAQTATDAPGGYIAPSLPTSADAAYPPPDAAGSSSPTEGDVALANPASVNCAARGGSLVIEERPDGGQFGVCVFDGGRQCEEWALMRGDCPVGGIDITSFVTAAGRYCAITGGTYAVAAEGSAETEQGMCMFADGSVCDAWAYWRGECQRGAP